MSPSVREAIASFAFAGVRPGAVRCRRPGGAGIYVAFCCRNGEPLYAEGASELEALERLLVAANLVAYLERAEAQQMTRAS